MRPLPLLWRTIVLRAVLTSALACFISSLVSCLSLQVGCTPHVTATMYTPLAFTLLHHLFRLWAPSWWWNITDLLCCLGEVGGGVFTLHFLWAGWIYIAPNLPGDLALGVSWSVLGASIFANLLILLWDITTNPGRSLLQPYNFSAGLGPDCPGRQWSFIFGTFTLKKRFNTDTRLIQWVRGGLATLCLAVLSFMIFYVFVGRPLLQDGYSVIKISKIPRESLTTDELQSTEPMEVKVVMDVPRLQNLQENAPEPFMSIDAKIWDTTISTINNPMSPVGQAVPGTTKCRDNGDWSQAQTCYHITQGYLIQADGPYDLSNPSTEILITVDFSAFGNASKIPFQVGVYPAVSTTTAISDIRPVYLAPGSHLYAISSVSFKEKSSSQGLAVLGIPKFRRVPILEVGHLFPDLLSSYPNNTASLRLFFPYANEFQLEREYFEGTLVDGLALIGGIWTFMNGLFATLFGCTLLLVLFGIKPLSIYGLVHLFQPKGSLVRQDRALSQEDRDWILEILSQHLLDDDIRASRMLQCHDNIPRSVSRDGARDHPEVEHLVEQSSAEPA